MHKLRTVKILIKLNPNKKHEPVSLLEYMMETIEQREGNNVTRKSEKQKKREERGRYRNQRTAKTCGYHRHVWREDKGFKQMNDTCLH